MKTEIPLGIGTHVKLKEDERIAGEVVAFRAAHNYNELFYVIHWLCIGTERLDTYNVYSADELIPTGSHNCK